jgi:rsbT antagonist protein RsbS
MMEMTILKIGDYLIVPIQTELHDMAANSLQENILKRIEKTGARGLIIEVGSVGIIDSFMGRILVDTAKMAGLMGSETVIVGMKKEVVMTLLQLGLMMQNLHTALDIEDGIALLNRLTGRNHERAII